MRPSHPAGTGTRGKSTGLLALLVSVLLLLGSAPIFALNRQQEISQFSLGIWGSAQGLPQNSVEAVVQTRDGYLWLGTQEGLARFDGVRFRIFDSGNTAAFTDNHVSAILEARDGTLWVGTFGGGLIRGRGGVFESVTTAPEAGHLGPVMALTEDTQGVLWIGTSATGLARLEGGQVTSLSHGNGLPSNQVRALLADPDGSLWVGTARGLVHVSSGKITVFGPAEGLSEDGVTALLRDSSGRLVVGTEMGLDVLGNDGRFRPVSSHPALAKTSVRCLREDRASVLWVGTNRGLLRLVGGRLDSLAVEDGLPDNAVSSLFEDREGNLWVGTDGGGVARLKDGKVATFTTRQGLPSNSTYALTGDGQDGLWVATYSSGVARFDGRAFTLLPGSDRLPGARIRALHQGASGTLWIGTDRGLHHLEHGRITSITTVQGLPSHKVRVIHEDRQGRLWVGTDGGGLAMIEAGGVRTYSRDDGLSGDQVRAILEEPGGALWIGTYGGLSRLENGRFTSYRVADGLSSDMVRSLHRDADGTLWVGTYGGGLNRFRDGKFVSVRQRDGLLSDVVFTVLEDDQGQLWMSCSKGIFHLARKQLDDFFAGRISSVSSVAYDESDGMESRECNGGSPAGFRTANGRLFFPTLKGVVMVDPEYTPQNTVPPPVAIEEMVADDTAFAPGARLRPGTTRFAFHYTALSFVAPQEVRFAYRLEGVDPDWVQVGPQRVAYYTHLPPGHYRFRVKAANEDGRWNQEGAAYEFLLEPHFYQRTGFHLAAIASLLAAAAGISRLRTRQTRTRERELTRRVQEGLAKIKTLSGLLPICAWCKKVRDDKGYWSQLETYVRDRTEADFTHGICPECMRAVAPAAAHKRANPDER